MRRLAPLLRSLACIVFAPLLPSVVLGLTTARAEGVGGVIQDAGVQLRWNYEKRAPLKTHDFRADDARNRARV